jgi:hypothetical protein
LIRFRHNKQLIMGGLFDRDEMLKQLTELKKENEELKEQVSRGEIFRLREKIRLIEQDNKSYVLKLKEKIKAEHQHMLEVYMIVEELWQLRKPEGFTEDDHRYERVVFNTYDGYMPDVEGVKAFNNHYQFLCRYLWELERERDLLKLSQKHR